MVEMTWYCDRLHIMTSDPVGNNVEFDFIFSITEFMFVLRHKMLHANKLGLLKCEKMCRFIFLYSHKSV